MTKVKSRAKKTIEGMIRNSSELIARSRLASILGFTHDGARDTYAAFGYPKQLTALQLYGLYSRNDIANRIVGAYPKATWREQPIIADEAGNSDDPTSQEFSPFVKSVNEFFENRNAMRLIERADRLASIGRFGVLFMGFSDGKTPDKPLDLTTKPKLLFASPYGETACTVAQFETDIQSPRYGLPRTYTLTGRSMTDGPSNPSRSITAHYSRIIHIAENLDENDVYGVPRLMPVYNRLLDLEKVVGGAAETFWLTANRGIAFWANDESNLGEDEINGVKQQADDFVHGLKRTIVGQQFSAQVLGSESPDPQPNSEVLLDLIAGAVGIPKRILMGTERGDLSSTQDENNWASRIDERRVNFGTPSILRPFIQKLIDTGNIDAPQGHWYVEWPDVGALGKAAEADIMDKKTTSLVNYSNSPEAQMIVPPGEFRKTFLGLDPESTFELPAIEELPPSLDVGGPGQTPTDPSNPSPAPTAAPGTTDPTMADPVSANLQVNMAPKPLYVSRAVKNTKALTEWAKGQGLSPVNDDLHVTVLYSKAPVDWLAVSPAWNEEDDGSFMVHPGGPRVVERFGSCVVLSFVSDGLLWRHRELVEAGGSHDWLKYQPHITICEDPDNLIDVSKIEPYTGAIALGPEIFEEAKVD